MFGLTVVKKKTLEAMKSEYRQSEKDARDLLIRNRRLDSQLGKQMAENGRLKREILAILEQKEKNSLLIEKLEELVKKLEGGRK